MTLEEQLLLALAEKLLKKTEEAHNEVKVFSGRVRSAVEIPIAFSEILKTPARTKDPLVTLGDLDISSKYLLTLLYYTFHEAPNDNYVEYTPGYFRNLESDTVSIPNPTIASKIKPPQARELFNATDSLVKAVDKLSGKFIPRSGKKNDYKS